MTFARRVGNARLVHRIPHSAMCVCKLKRPSMLLFRPGCFENGALSIPAHPRSRGADRLESVNGAPIAPPATRPDRPRHGAPECGRGPERPHARKDPAPGAHLLARPASFIRDDRGALRSVRGATSAAGSLHRPSLDHREARRRWTPGDHGLRRNAMAPGRANGGGTSRGFGRTRSLPPALPDAIGARALSSTGAGNLR